MPNPIKNQVYLKHAVHLKVSFKWALNKQAGEASTLGKDPGVIGFENPVLGRCFTQRCGPLVDSLLVIISKLDVEHVVQTPPGADVDASSRYPSSHGGTFGASSRKHFPPSSPLRFCQ